MNTEWQGVGGTDNTSGRLPLLNEYRASLAIRRPAGRTIKR